MGAEEKAGGSVAGSAARGNPRSPCHTRTRYCRCAFQARARHRLDSSRCRRARRRFCSRGACTCARSARPSLVGTVLATVVEPERAAAAGAARAAVLREAAAGVVMRPLAQRNPESSSLCPPARVPKATSPETTALLPRGAVAAPSATGSLGSRPKPWHLPGQPTAKTGLGLL